jgi:hypothetical protein
MRKVGFGTTRGSAPWQDSLSQSSKARGMRRGLLTARILGPRCGLCC